MPKTLDAFNFPDAIWKIIPEFSDSVFEGITDYTNKMVKT